MAPFSIDSLGYGHDLLTHRRPDALHHAEVTKYIPSPSICLYWAMLVALALLTIREGVDAAGL